MTPANHARRFEAEPGATADVLGFPAQPLAQQLKALEWRLMEARRAGRPEADEMARAVAGLRRRIAAANGEPPPHTD